MRVPIIAGNWKMYKTRQESSVFWLPDISMTIFGKGFQDILRKNNVKRLFGPHEDP